MLFFVRVIRFDAHALARLLHINLNVLREGFRLVARAGLHANRRGDFHLPAGLAVETDLAKLVLNAHGLPGAQRHALLKIFRDLLLSICAKHRLTREEHGEHARNWCEMQQSSPKNGLGAIHRCLASKTSSSVRCFSWYMASN